MSHSKPLKRTSLKHPASSLRIWRASLVLFWEKAWPALLPILAPISLLIIISLFDGWRLMPVIVHWLSLLIAILVTGWAIFRYQPEFKWPSRHAAIERLEADGALEHTPLQALEDKLFQVPFEEAQTSEALWAAHKQAMAKAAQGVKLKTAHTTADARDRFALRYPVVGLLILGFFAAGPQSLLRLQGVFLPGAARQEIASRADMWIEPPAYTGLAPIYLVQGGDNFPDIADQVDVPEGSILVAQINGERGAQLSFIDTDGNDQLAQTPDTNNNQSKNTTTGKKNAERLELALTENGLIDLRLGGKRGRWPVLAIEDKAPLVTYMTTPEEGKNRDIKLHYVFEDDYGATETHIAFRLNPDQARPLDAPLLEDVALNVTRKIALDGTSGHSGERRANVPVESDPWAGLDVLARVIITDGAGHTGQTEEVNVTLPAREFFNPLAKAVIEQRQTLAIASNDSQRVRDALNAVTILPEEFYEDTSEYLLMRTAFWRVQRETDDRFTETIEHFWPLALELEDKALELARRRLEAAIEALREALEADAPQAEVKKLNDELAQAIDDYLQALAQAGVPEGGDAGSGSEQIGANTIQEMLDAIDDLSESGANNAARQMLGDLDNLLKNLKLQQGNGGGDGIPSPGNGAPSEGPGEEAGELIGRQRELSDRSFERSQKPGSGGEDLADEQQEISRALEELLENIQNGQQGSQQGNQQGGGSESGQSSGGGSDGSDSGNDAAGALEEALREMRRSEQALSNGNFDNAGSAMDRAIGKLREGAQALAEEQARRQGQNGESSGQGSQRGDNGEEGLDPLGRPTGGTGGGNIGVPDGADPALTRELIQKMRERLGEQGRSQEEIDYLERLLEAF